MMTVALPAYVCTNPVPGTEAPRVVVFSALDSGGSAGLMDITIHLTSGITGPRAQNMATEHLKGGPHFSPTCGSFVLKVVEVVPGQNPSTCNACLKREVKTGRYSWSPVQHGFVEVLN